MKCKCGNSWWTNNFTNPKFEWEWKCGTLFFRGFKNVDAMTNVNTLLITENVSNTYIYVFFILCCIVYAETDLSPLSRTLCIISNYSITYASLIPNDTKISFQQSWRGTRRNHKFSVIVNKKMCENITLARRRDAFDCIVSSRLRLARRPLFILKKGVLFLV